MTVHLQAGYYRKIICFSPSSMADILGRLIVNFVVLLISFIAYSSQIFVIWPWYGGVLSVELIVLLLPFKFVTSVYSG